MSKLSKKTQQFYNKNKEAISISCSVHTLFGAGLKKDKSGNVVKTELKNGIKDFPMVRMLHVKDNQFLIAYEDFCFDLVDIKDLEEKHSESIKGPSEDI